MYILHRCKIMISSRNATGFLSTSFLTEYNSVLHTIYFIMNSSTYLCHTLYHKGIVDYQFP